MEDLRAQYRELRYTGKFTPTRTSPVPSVAVSVNGDDEQNDTMFGARLGFADAGAVGPGMEQPNAPTVPVPMDEGPGLVGNLLGFHGFYKWVFAALAVLNDFVTVGRLGYTGGLLGLRKILTSRILVEPHLIDDEFRKAWMPFFCRSGHPVVTVDQFLDFVDPFLHQEAVLDLPRITGQDLLGSLRLGGMLC